MSNMQYYEALQSVPDDAKSKIKGGRLSGMTDINPQWRYQRMTEVFGACGTGWHYTIDKLWTEPSDATGEILAFALVSVYIVGDAGESAPITGVGGSKLVMQENAGPRANDEAYKMAVTDALGTAMKMLGLAADVYRGYSDSKYNSGSNRHAAQTSKDGLKHDDRMIAECRALFREVKDAGNMTPDVDQWVQDTMKLGTAEAYKSVQNHLTKLKGGSK